MLNLAHAGVRGVRELQVCGGPGLGPGVPAGTRWAIRWALAIPYLRYTMETGWVVPRYSTPPGTTQLPHPAGTPRRAPS